MPTNFSFDVLSDGSLIVTLSSACIQTTAKRAHRELTTALLDGRAEGTSIEALLEMLERFLTTTDFAALRAEHPELARGTRYRVRLYRSNDGVVRWENTGPT